MPPPFCLPLKLKGDFRPRRSLAKADIYISYWNIKVNTSTAFSPKVKSPTSVKFAKNYLPKSASFHFPPPLLY